MAGLMLCLVLGVALIGIVYVVGKSDRRDQLAKAENEILAVKSLTASSLTEAVDVFDSPKQSQEDVQNHPDFAGINQLFQKVSDASDWEDMKAVYPFFDFKKYSAEVGAAPATRRFYANYDSREITRSLRSFGVFITPFGDWEISEIQKLSSSERLVYVQIQLSYDVEVRRCRFWVTQNRFSGWKIYDWEDMSELCRASSEAAGVVAEPSNVYNDGYNKYVDLLDLVVDLEGSDPEYARNLKKCESLRLNPDVRPGVLLNVGTYWLSIDKPKQAIRCVDQIRNKNLIPEVYRLEGNAHEALEDYEAAIEKYQLFIKKVGRHADVLDSLVNCFEQLGDTEQQQAYQLERIKTWPGQSCQFDAAELLEYYHDEPSKLFDAIGCSSQSKEIYRKLFEQLAGNPFLVSDLRIVSDHFDKAGIEEPQLRQRAAAQLALAEGQYDEFRSQLLAVYQQDSNASINEKWTEIIEYDLHQELFEVTKDKEAAFEAMVSIYLYGDWYASEASFESICDTCFNQFPNNKFAVYFKGYQSFKAEKYDEAMRLFKSIEGKMEGDYEYLNDNIIDWQLRGLFDQKQFDKAIEFARQKKATQKLLVIAEDYEAQQVIDRLAVEDLESPVDLVLKGLQALGKNQDKLAARHLSSFLNKSEKQYRLENVALTALVKSQDGVPAFKILQATPRYSVYRRLANILLDNKDWEQLEALSKTASNVLKEELKENGYGEGYVLTSLNRAQWNHRKFSSILKRYRLLKDKTKTKDTTFVLWAACMQKDFGLAKQICKTNSSQYSYQPDLALVAAFEKDTEAFKKAASELGPYEKAALEKTLLTLRVDDQFRQLLYRDTEPVDLDFTNSNVELIEAIFPADWSLADEQIEAAIAELSDINNDGSDFKLVSSSVVGEKKIWAARSKTCGILVKLNHQNRESVIEARSPLRRRLVSIRAADHQHLAVSVFPIAADTESKQVAARKQKPVSYYSMAAKLFVSVSKQMPLALDTGDGWSDDKVLFERVECLAGGKPFNKLYSLDTVYNYSGEDGGEYSRKNLEFQSKLAQAFQRYRSSADPKKKLTATVKPTGISVERIPLKMDENFEPFSYYTGATFRGTVTQTSQPFGLYQAGDRLEFTDSEVVNWKLELENETLSGQHWID